MVSSAIITLFIFFLLSSVLVLYCVEILMSTCFTESTVWQDHYDYFDWPLNSPHSATQLTEELRRFGLSCTRLLNTLLSLNSTFQEMALYIPMEFRLIFWMDNICSFFLLFMLVLVFYFVVLEENQAFMNQISFCFFFTTNLNKSKWDGLHEPVLIKTKAINIMWRVYSLTVLLVHSFAQMLPSNHTEGEKSVIKSVTFKIFNILLKFPLKFYIV